MIVSVSGLSCTRGGRRLFTGLSFTLAAGESLRLAGPNGVGKSSLIRQICGLVPCTEGRVSLNASPALADERAALDGDRRLGEALRFWAGLDGVPTPLLDQAIERMGLGVIAELPVRMLSTGQRKRAALARVLASGATLWLLDEPGNGLDEASLSALGQAMDVHVAGGGAIVAASHFDLPHAFTRTLDIRNYAP